MLKKEMIFAVLMLLFFLSFFNMPYCFAQYFYSEEYSGQLRMGLRGTAASNKDFWGYADIFIPVFNNQESILYGANDFLIFLNPKVTLSDFSTNEENVGLGIRYLNSDFIFEQGMIFGGNIFYDTAYSSNGCRHHQIGFGIEVLSQQIDLRSNYYLPVTDPQEVDDVYQFEQSSLMRYFTEEEPLKGYDLEAGIPVPFLSRLVETWVYAGSYHYGSSISDDINGTKGRLEVSPSPLVTFNLEIKDDNVSGNNTFIGCYITLPFEMGNFEKRKNPFEGWQEVLRFREGPRSLNERMCDPVIRDINIITAKRRQPTKIADVIFVDNQNDGDVLEDGTLDHPHNTLAEAFSDSDYQDGVWIYVKSGDGTSTGYTGNFVLADRVVLWGQGYKYYGLGGGIFPVIDGGGTGDVITLGNDNRVMGLKIQNGTRGIYGENINAVTLNNNIVTSNNGTGIRLQTNGANICRAVLSNNTITGDTVGNGVVLYSESSSEITADLSGNLISGNDITGVYVWSGDSSSITANLLNNTIITNDGGGVYLQSNSNSTLNCLLAGNQIYENYQDGMHLQYLGTSVLTLDMGGGSLGSAGNNSIYDNTSDEVEDETATLTVKAENNWWGRKTPSENQFKGFIDYTPWLEYDPNL